ncbi:DUF2155 domain-containing protein [Albibacillus kandeliae]|uniref:DUF2155 domain-containing protein n=1 Tax=Albibacillus kandeliae TaxID=2174228 RepID=UPI000D698890|nr:DUF2155 domain-containing protein [Albibacillus kandeliae]
MIRALAAAAVLLTAPAVAQDQGAERVASGQGAVLRGLDKVSGQTVDVEIYSGGGAAVLGLEVEMADCRYPVDNPTGDAFAFVTVHETEKPDILFRGWMIASAPALNALDNSRYDVWVLRCITS